MNRIGKESTVRPLHAQSPSLTVRVGNQQWLVGPGAAQDSQSSGESDSEWNRITESEDVDSYKDLARASSRGSGRVSSWLESIVRSVEDVFDPHINPAETQEFAPATPTARAYRFRNRNKKNRRTIRAAHRRLRETFQLGCLFGLVLGCLSMVLFHQMEPGRDVASKMPVQSQPILAPNTHTFAVPAMQVQVLSSQPYKSRVDAERAAERLSREGVPAVVHCDGYRYNIWTSVALGGSHLKADQSAAAKKGISVSNQSVNFAVKRIPALSGANEASMGDIDNWLSSAESALTSLTAVLSDGGVPEDALTAYGTAKQAEPAAEELDETGRGAMLKDFAQQVDAAVQDYKSKKITDAMQHVLSAYELLFQLHQ